MRYHHTTLSHHVIKCFEELNEHYDGTMNQIHILSFSTDRSPNKDKVFTYKESMNQEDAHLFVQAMQKEVADHKLQDHWTIVPCSTVLKTTTPIQAIWSLKQKQRPDGTSVKHKARLCAHGGVQQWGTNYWETYSLVVNMVTICLILLLARIYKLDSKAIDFVLAFLCKYCTFATVCTSRYILWQKCSNYTKAQVEPTIGHLFQCRLYFGPKGFARDTSLVRAAVFVRY
jgi:hypothetical protein